MSDTSEPTMSDALTLVKVALQQIGDGNDTACIESWDIDRRGLTWSYRCVYTIHGREFSALMMVGRGGELPSVALILERMQAEVDYLAGVTAS